jgi:hypothetical protein
LAPFGSPELSFGLRAKVNVGGTAEGETSTDVPPIVDATQPGQEISKVALAGKTLARKPQTPNPTGAINLPSIAPI